jgi:DNA-binding CsgD family transcriptional regulator
LPEALRAEEIYEAALDESAPHRLPEMLAHTCGGRSAVLSWRHDDGAFDILGYHSLSEDLMSDYVNVSAAHDVWSIMAMKPSVANRVVSEGEIASSKSFSSTVFYNDFIRKHGEDIVHVLGGSQSSPFGSGLLGIYRNRCDDPFDAEDKAKLTYIMNNIRSALMLRGRLVTAQHTVRSNRAAWDTIRSACIIVRNDGRIFQHNAAADLVFRRADCLRFANGKLTATQQDQQDRLIRAIRRATASREPTSSSLRMETKQGVQYLISVAPISRHAGPNVALVLFKDPLASQSLLSDQLKSSWDLTSHEAFVAAELAEGRAIAEIAERRGVLESTVKTQLKAISAKMGVRGQAGLIAKMRMLP